MCTYRAPASVALAVAVQLMAYTTAAPASVVLLDNQLAFEQAGRNPIERISFAGFSGSNIPGDSFSDTTTFFSPEASDTSLVRVFVNSTGANIADSSGSSRNGVGPLRVEFTEVIGAISFLTSNASTNARITVFDQNDMLIGELHAPRPDGFIGILADEPIGAFEIVGGLTQSGLRDRVGLTQLVLYDVPEPGSVLVMATSMLAMLRSRCRH